MNWIEPIIDRNYADVAEAKRLLELGWDNMTPEEQDDYWKGYKGSYTAIDTGRVENNVQVIAVLLAALGFDIAVHLFSWADEDIPPPADTQVYLDNIRAIRKQIKVSPSTPPVPDSMEHFTYEDANDIEKILLDVFSLLNNGASVIPRASSRFFQSGYLLSVAETTEQDVPSAPSITTASVPDGIVGDWYEIQLESDNVSPESWDILNGWLPRGLTLSKGGLISGYPLTAGDFAITAIVTNGGGSDSKQFSMSTAIHNVQMQAGGQFSQAGNTLHFRGELK